MIVVIICLAHNITQMTNNHLIIFLKYLFLRSSEPRSAFYGAPSNPIGETEVTNLRCSVLAAAAYVTLCLGDYLIALEYAQDLLKQKAISGVHKMLGHLYAAEACIFNDKISEALQHLNPDLITDLSIGLSQPVEDCVEENSKPLKGIIFKTKFL